MTSDTKNLECLLESRIQWVRKQLESKITIEESTNFQWLLQHLISIQDGEELD